MMLNMGNNLFKNDAKIIKYNTKLVFKRTNGQVIHIYRLEHQRSVQFILASIRQYQIFQLVSINIFL